MSTISLGRSGIVGISYSETSLLKSNLMRANERRNSASNNINSAKVKLQVNGRSGRIRVETDNLQSYYSSLKSNNSKIEKIIRDIDYIVRKFKEVDSRCASRVRAISRSYKVQSFISKIGNSLISFGNKVFNGVSSFFKDGINIIKSIYNSASNGVEWAYRSVTDWFDRHQLAGNIISFGLNALAVILFIEVYRYYLSKGNKDFWSDMAFLFILSGALCSLIDKTFYGGSLDFIGISNLFIADIKDIYINLGILFFIMLIYIKGYFKEEDSSTLKDDLQSVKKFFKFMKNDIFRK